MNNKSRPLLTNAQPGEELLQEIRAGFIAQGSTLTGYCRDHDISLPNARMAILGGWRGPKARVLIKKLMAAAGIREAA